jgi:anti-sigma-K factor RskA
MNLGTPEERTVACAEFVLGTLDDADLVEFREALILDASLQDEVGFWQDRLMGLSRSIGPVEPSDEVWQRIDAAIATAPAGTVPSEPKRRPYPPRSGGAIRFWDRLAFWQGLSGLAVAAVLLLGLLFVMRSGSSPEASYVAVLQTGDRQLAWIVKAEAAGPLRIVPVGDPGPVPAGKTWELWTKGKDAAAPTSLGLLRAGAAEIPRAALPYLGEEQLFEVTLEPEGGSPTGRPTGQVLALGRTQRI